MDQKIAAFMDKQNFGLMPQGYQDDSAAPVLATPAAVATCWYVGGAVVGAAAVVGAYVTGRVNG